MITRIDTSIKSLEELIAQINKRLELIDREFMIKSGDLNVPTNRGLIWGDHKTEGSWRIRVDGVYLKIERMENGRWQTKLKAIGESEIENADGTLEDATEKINLIIDRLE